jgi:pyruvate/2-oxoglutarate dehydrogenase complex dihydrolipoamide dehydrogenase (E3) component
MVVIGAGAGGLVSSSIAAGLGGKVAIIEVPRLQRNKYLVIE